MMMISARAAFISSLGRSDNFSDTRLSIKLSNDSRGAVLGKRCTALVTKLSLFSDRAQGGEDLIKKWPLGLRGVDPFPQGYPSSFIRAFYCISKMTLLRRSKFEHAGEYCRGVGCYRLHFGHWI